MAAPRHLSLLKPAATQIIPSRSPLMALKASSWAHFFSFCILFFLYTTTLSNLIESIIATSIVHSKLDYYNSLFLNLDSAQIQRLQFIQNSLNPLYPIILLAHPLSTHGHFSNRAISITAPCLWNDLYHLNSAPFLYLHHGTVHKVRNAIVGQF